jgi:uncharacterized Zn finger protein
VFLRGHRFTFLLGVANVTWFGYSDGDGRLVSETEDPPYPSGAGEAAFGRGLAYYREGMVVGWNKQGATITADVEGSQCYRVVLKLSKRGLDGACDCPASESIDFCKHCVAVALTYRADQAEQPPQLPAEKSLALMDYALSRMDRALETLDDLRKAPGRLRPRV